MSNSVLIMRLYDWVLYNDMVRHEVNIEDVVEGIEYLNGAYKHNPLRITDVDADAVDFRPTAFRCAYLHKYASLHTILVSDIFIRVLHQNYNHFHYIISNARALSICSLGGGPGSDIIGILLTLRMFFGKFMVSSVVIDCMPSWNETLNSLFREVQHGSHKELNSYLNLEYFRWNYIGANLLKEFSADVEEAIKQADIINMIKFVSAASCADTEIMIQKIFLLMKPGAIAFFIDNSVGKIKHIMKNAALDYNLKSIFGPISHEQYSNSSVRNKKFNYLSCNKTNVAIQVWLKPFDSSTSVHSLETKQNMQVKREKCYLEPQIPKTSFQFSNQSSRSVRLNTSDMFLNNSYSVNSEYWEIEKQPSFTLNSGINPEIWQTHQDLTFNSDVDEDYESCIRFNNCDIDWRECSFNVNQNIDGDSFDVSHKSCRSQSNYLDIPNASPENWNNGAIESSHKFQNKFRSKQNRQPFKSRWSGFKANKKNGYSKFDRKYKRFNPKENREMKIGKQTSVLRKAKFSKPVSHTRYGNGRVRFQRCR